MGILDIFRKKKQPQRPLINIDADTEANISISPRAKRKKPARKAAPKRKTVKRSAPRKSKAKASRKAKSARKPKRSARKKK